MALFRRKADPDAPRLGIYIHIPFCVRKCDYCDFYSVPGRDGRMDEYLHALEVHIAESAPQAELYTVNTIYFGGGTPTFFGAERLARLLQIVRKQFNVSKDCEITVECNPDSADQDTLLTLKKAGVTIRAGQGTGGNRPGTQLCSGYPGLPARQRRGFRQYFAGSHLWPA